MNVFLNVNSVINFDTAAKNICWWWTGNKVLVNVGLLVTIE